MKILKANYLGRFTLESCQKVSIKDLLALVKRKLTKEILSMELDWIELIQTSAHYGWVRYWFKCPLCEQKVCNLYQIPKKESLCCRKCSGLKYKKQRFKGMIEEKIGNL